MLHNKLSDTITPREQMTWEHEKEMARLYHEQAVTMKQLELDLARLEAKWSSWLRIPKLLVLLPVLLVLSIGAVISAARKSDFHVKFWDLLR